MVLIFAWGVALAANPVLRRAGMGTPHLDFSRPVRPRDGSVVALLFSRVAARSGLEIAPIDKLSVVFVILFAALFLGESLTWKTALGGALIAAGALVLATK